MEVGFKVLVVLGFDHNFKGGNYILNYTMFEDKFLS